MNRRIHVAACCDENYAPYVAVMMLSALSSTVDTPITFHLINCSISPESINKLQDLIARHKSTLEIYQPDDRLYRGLPTLRYGEAVYQRINLPEYIPTDIERILYIDADTLVLGDLNELWQLDLKGHLVAAVENLSPRACKDIGFPRTEYFNSGVLLIDLDGWRRESIHKQVTDYARKNAHRLQYVDQCSLNAVLRGRWLRLMPGWNQQSDIYKVLKKYSEGGSYSRESMEEAILNPKIVHFTGKKKPWKVYCFHPFKTQYKERLNTTPWENLPPPDGEFKVYLKYYFALRQRWKCHKRQSAVKKFQRSKTHHDT
ncbi:glycosyltransferase family 8 protein [Marinobacter sp. F3R11]|uniref:glycosyltransferase family 8 protein n=1 Tax=Marinobacter sp. F3R11 TaxID=2267231 RepID=UPI000DE850D6|nr:glycosyltransferase family 8 protein [Marinobacter sp. F3R11]RBW48118.1 glycosyltransferase family 8 protein [Marinobacter sp. F3R11]